MPQQLLVRLLNLSQYFEIGEIQFLIAFTFLGNPSVEHPVVLFQEALADRAAVRNFEGIPA